MRVIAGLLPAAGKVLLDGEPVAGLSRQACAQRVALVPQQNAVDHGLRVHEVVLMGRAPHQGSLLRTRAQDVEIVAMPTEVEPESPCGTSDSDASYSTDKEVLVNYLKDKLKKRLS